MAKGTLAIRRQIRSIGNTKKMTKAMELVSASKMRRAVTAALATRPYATTAWDILSRLDPNHDEQLHPLLAKRPVKTLGIVLVSTNRGLCGGFNNALLAQVQRTVAREKESGATHTLLFSLGKKGGELAARSGYTVKADFPKNDITRSIMDVAPISHVISDMYIRGELDKVILVAMHFVSSVKQSSVAKTLLPLEVEEHHREGTTATLPVLFEPSDTEVIKAVLPRLLDVQIFQAVLESEASEHSARMLAMHNATSSASDLLSDLSLTYNQIRQAGITQEIAEISSGRAALE
ncbi:MAG: ATP synthase F1 subunit gamma [Patescibacteria group bacterium]